MRNGGMRPDLACFKMVNFETVNSRRVRWLCSIWSAAVQVLSCCFLELHESVRVLTRLDSRWHPYCQNNLTVEKKHGRSPGSMQPSLGSFLPGGRLAACLARP